MSPEAKRLKITSLITMGIGFVAIICGFVFIDQGADPSDLFVLVAGVITMLIGAQGARVANVPSNAKGLIAPAGGVTAVDAAATAGTAALAAGQIVPVIVTAVTCVFSLAVTLVARAVKRKLERV